MGLLDRIVCVSPLSKNLEGELALVHSEPERCPQLDCVTLETQHHLKLAVSAFDCDSKAASLLDGTLASGDLAHKFADGDGTHRGVHEGTFRWSGRGVAIVGTLRGVTNAGTHRAPAFDDCQKCDNPGVMEGLLVGTIRRAPDRRLIGCTVQAAYRLRFEASPKGGSGKVAGTLEGAIVCDCPAPPRTCIDFTILGVGSGPPPLIQSGAAFETFDNLGNLSAWEIRPQGAFTGLDVRFTTQIKPPPCSRIEASLVTFAQAATLEAFDAAGTSLGTASMSGTQQNIETLIVTAPGIVQATIRAPSDETLLLGFCFS